MNGNGIRADLYLFRPVTFVVSAASCLSNVSIPQRMFALDVLVALSEGMDIRSPGQVQSFLMDYTR
jgi:hypothetical protein